MTRTEKIKQMVAKRQDRLNALNDEIWNYAELYSGRKNPPRP